MIWTTANGRKIPISELTDNHLLNIINMVAAAGNRLRDYEAMKMINGVQPTGNGARVCFESELDYFAHCEWIVFYPKDKQPTIKALLDEAGKRKICVPN